MYKLLENIAQKYSGKVAGVDVFFIGETLSISYVVLKKVKNQLEIVDQGNDLKSIKSLTEKIGKNIPVNISLNGKAIIHKTYTPAKNGENELQIVKQVIPGVAIDSIFYQIVDDKDDQRKFVSCSRKELIDNLLESLKAAGLLVQQILLGSYSCAGIVSVINEKKVDAGRYSFMLEDFTGTYKENEEYRTTEHYIENEKLDGDLLTSYCNALLWYINPNKVSSTINASLVDLEEEFTYKFWFQRAGAILLAVVFALLLINFLVYSGRSAKIAETQQKLSINKETLENIKNLSHEIEKKEAYLIENNILKGTRHSFQADRIAGHVTKNMRLNSIHIRPAESDLLQNQKFNYQPIIYVTGQSSAEALELFTKNLTTEDWIKNTDVIDLKSVNERGRVKFIIQLQL